MRNVKVPTQWKINLILVVRKPEIKFKVPASYLKEFAQQIPSSSLRATKVKM